jgi:hypothetical protein
MLKLEPLASCSENEVMKFHGFGKSSLPVLKAALESVDLSFKQ